MDDMVYRHDSQDGSQADGAATDVDGKGRELCSDCEWKAMDEGDVATEEQECRQDVGGRSVGWEKR